MVWNVAGRRVAAAAGVGVYIENNRGGCFDACCSVAVCFGLKSKTHRQCRKWQYGSMSKKKENNMIRRSVDYRQDLTNQIRLCKFLVRDTPSVRIVHRSSVQLFHVSLRAKKEWWTGWNLCVCSCVRAGQVRWCSSRKSSCPGSAVRVWTQSPAWQPWAERMEPCRYTHTNPPTHTHTYTQICTYIDIPKVVSSPSSLVCTLRMCAHTCINLQALAHLIRVDWGEEEVVVVGLL